ncbi:MAG: endonuclease/exonuclease/phosphatase family protein [Kiritimatiellales bacterium]|nr:endonuclease/exonuclease/phosphatase family protein [Kiritimatiellales bacterium]
MKFADKKMMDRLCVIGGAGLAIATLLGFLGRFCWVFDLFSHFRVQYFQLALILIGIAIWKRSNRLLITFVLLACLNYAFVLPLYFGKPPVASEKPARAMLMNILASNGNASQVLEAIAAANPDILLLEEVTPKWVEALGELDYPYRFADVRDDCFGIMLLSRYPLSKTNVVFVGMAGVPTLTANVHLPQGDVALIGTHPLPPFNGEYSKHRNAQLAALSELAGRQSKPVLLIGDLNASPWSAHFVRLLKESGLKNSMKGFGFQPSWPADNRLLRIPIDHMLHSSEIVIHRRSVGPSVGSDHFPVMVDFSIQK